MGVDISAAFGMPPEDAVSFFEAKGYKVTENWRELWQEAHARAFTVAGVTNMEVLTDIRSALAKALKEGKTLKQFSDQIIPTLKDKGWWGRLAQVDKETGEWKGWGLTPARLSLIYQQNLQTSYMAGRWKAMQAAVVTHPYWQYIAVMDKRTRPAHAALNGMVFRADDPIWQSIFPPNGFRCRCRVRPLTQAAVDREGHKVWDSTAYTKDIQVPISPRNPDLGTTTVTQVSMPGRPVFTVDAGFNYNPGQVAFQPELDKYAPEVASQYVHGVLTGPEFQGWYEHLQQAVAEARKEHPAMPNGDLRTLLRPQLVVGQKYPVAVLKPADRELLGAKTGTVLLSDETLVKQFISREGQDVGLADYWQVQPTIQDADVVIKSADSANHFLFYRRGQKYFMAVVKSAAGGKEVYLQSFRQVGAAEHKKLEKKGEIVRRKPGSE